MSFSHFHMEMFLPFDSNFHSQIFTQKELFSLNFPYHIKRDFGYSNKNIYNSTLIELKSISRSRVSPIMRIQKITFWVL